MTAKPTTDDTTDTDKQKRINRSMAAAVALGAVIIAYTAGSATRTATVETVAVTAPATTVTPTTITPTTIKATTTTEATTTTTTAPTQTELMAEWMGEHPQLGYHMSWLADTFTSIPTTALWAWCLETGQEHQNKWGPDGTQDDIRQAYKESPDPTLSEYGQQMFTQMTEGLDLCSQTRYQQSTPHFEQAHTAINELTIRFQQISTEL
jgi:hypothetical protein